MNAIFYCCWYGVFQRVEFNAVKEWIKERGQGDKITTQSLIFIYLLIYLFICLKSQNTTKGVHA